MALMQSDEIEKYKTVSGEVDEVLADIVNEMSRAIGSLDDEPLLVRTRLLIAFSFLEVVCNVFNAFLDLKLRNRALMEKWLKEFCLNDINPAFAAHPYARMVTPAHMYKFRNAIVHSFALPEPDGGITITVPTVNEMAESITAAHAAYRDAGQHVAFISAGGLMNIFTAGYQIMHVFLFKNPEIATKKDLEGLERVLIEFNKRGAKFMPL